jgi:WD40 repeat protein
MAQNSKAFERKIKLFKRLVRTLGGALLPTAAFAFLSAAVWSGSSRADEAPILKLDVGGHIGGITGLAFTPDGKQIVTSGEDKTIRVWDVETGRTVRVIRGQEGPERAGRLAALALSPDGRWLAVGGELDGAELSKMESSSAIRLYEFSSGRLVGLLKGHRRNGVVSLAFSPDSRLLVSGSGEMKTILWDVASRRQLHALAGQEGGLVSGMTARFSPDGERVAAILADFIGLWRVKDGQQIALLEGHKKKVTTLAVSPADGSIASGGEDGEIRLWNGRTGNFLRKIANQGDYVTSLVFTKDGRKLISGGAGAPGLDSTAPASASHCHVWDVKSGAKLFDCAKHKGRVNYLALSPDGRRAASAGGADGSIQIWDAERGKIYKTIRGVGQTVFDVAFSADNKTIAWSYANPCPGKTSCFNKHSRLERQLRLPLDGAPLVAPEPVSRRNDQSWRRSSVTYGSVKLAHKQKDFIIGGLIAMNQSVLEVSKGGKVLSRIDVRLSSGSTITAQTSSPAPSIWPTPKKPRLRSELPLRRRS